MQYVLRTELMNEFNMLKKTLKEAEENGEISRKERVKIMSEIGKIKAILYSDVVFKDVYTKQEHVLFKALA